jgi:hypothetical protein
MFGVKLGVKPTGEVLMVLFIVLFPLFDDLILVTEGAIVEIFLCHFCGYPVGLRDADIPSGDDLVEC